MKEEMSEKSKIIMIYSSVAVIVTALLLGFSWIGKLKAERDAISEKNRQGLVRDVQVQGLEESIGQHKFLDLKEDFTAVNQLGETVNFQDLKGKVWVFAQFYGSCPECNSSNLGVLKELYEKYKGNDHFQIVTVSVKTEVDSTKLMSDMAKGYGADAKNWWFLSADVEKVNAFCQQHMGYMAFKKNDKFGEPNPQGKQGEINHDMGIAVFDAEMGMWAKVDIYNPKHQGNILGAKIAREKLFLTVEWALKKLKTQSASNE